MNEKEIYDRLKWFLDWKFFGREGLGKRVEEYLLLCEYAESLVTHPDATNHDVDHLFVEGIVDRYDNSIHRITALEESLSLHMYSDDALKGICYRDYPESSPLLTDDCGEPTLQSSIQ